MITLIAETNILKTALDILLAFVVLMVMVLIHELGHYTAGKLLGFKINEFAVGMGPKIISHTKKNGEVISLRLLPLGGFCAFEGEGDENDSPQAFNNQAPWKRVIVLLAGVTFNFVSAIIIAVFTFTFYGASVAKIVDVYENSPAYGVVESGDIVYSVDGHVVYVSTDYSNYFPKDDTAFDMQVFRNGELLTLHNLHKAEVEYVDEDGNTQTYFGVGVSANFAERQKYSFGQSLQRTVPYCWNVGTLVLRSLGGIFTGDVGIDELGGPVTTIQMTSQVVETGFGNVLTLIILISVNLGVFNLLPIPSLDGCQTLFTVWEWITHKPIDYKVQGIINTIGLVLLLGFVILIDVLKLF